MTVTIRQVDTHRVELYVGDKLFSYAVLDAWGWSLMRRIDGKIRTVQRIEFGTTARRNARVLVELVANLGRPGAERPSPPPRRTCANLHELERIAAVLDLPVSYFTERPALNTKQAAVVAR